MCVLPPSVTFLLCAPCSAPHLPLAPQLLLTALCCAACPSSTAPPLKQLPKPPCWPRLYNKMMLPPLNETQWAL